MRQIIDLRTQTQREGITSAQQTSQAIAGILQTVGQAEQKRRERQQLDRIVRAISEGATTIEAIAAATRQEPQFSTGIPGALQRFGGAFQPSPGGTQQAIVGQALQQALAPKAQFPQGLTGPQLEAWGYSPEEWAERNIRKVTKPTAKPPKRPKVIEERWHEAETKKPEQILKDKVSEAQSNPDVAAETYRQSLEALGYDDEEIEQLKQIFREGDAEKIRIAIERIESY